MILLEASSGSTSLKIADKGGTKGDCNCRQGIEQSMFACPDENMPFRDTVK